MLHLIRVEASAVHSTEKEFNDFEIFHYWNKTKTNKQYPMNQIGWINI